MKVHFNGFDCNLEFAQYGNGRTALQLVDAADGELVATATVNIPGKSLLPHQVFIKDYSENEGMFKALQEAGIVRLMGRVPCGYSSALMRPAHATPVAGKESDAGKILAGQAPRAGGYQPVGSTAGASEGENPRLRDGPLSKR